MMKVEIKESALVPPAQVLPVERLWISNMDLMHVRNYRHTVYLYKPNGSSRNFFEAKVLKESLSKALVPFYPVAGRLAKDENGRIEINCNGDGVLFVEAETDSTTTELGDFMPSLELQQLIPTLGNLSGDIFSHPLLRLQVTKFKCGNVCLGVEWHHVLADGTGALHFLNSWAAMARGLSLTTQPLIDRTILRCRVPPSPAFHHAECDPTPTMNNPTKNPKSKSMANLMITLDQLNTLKAKANNNETRMKYTSYEILLAHIWRCTCKARGLPFDQETRVSISVDGRSRLHPPISNEYFGNVIFTTTSLALSGEILSEPLPQTAGRIQKAIKRMDDAYLRSSIDCLEGVEDVANIMRGPQNSGCPNLAITNWLRLPIYETDFGWGPPLLLRPTKMNEGKGYLHPNPANDGSLLLAICLETDPMESFKNTFYDF